MVQFTKDGYFEGGKFVKGLHPSMIGKKIIRTRYCQCPGYTDHSYSYVGINDTRSPHNWVVLHKINPDGTFVIEWSPQLFPGKLSKQEAYWNDGLWVEYDPKVHV